MPLNKTKDAPYIVYPPTEKPERRLRAIRVIPKNKTIIPVSWLINFNAPERRARIPETMKHAARMLVNRKPFSCRITPIEICRLEFLNSTPIMISAAAAPSIAPRTPKIDPTCHIQREGWIILNLFLFILSFLLSVTEIRDLVECSFTTVNVNPAAVCQWSLFGI